MRRLVLTAAALGAAGVAGYKLLLEPWWKAWGVEPDEAAMPLPGDELILEARASETRGIVIDAPPAAIWPWLVQMGYGRAGWYSYDAIDMEGESAGRIVPEWQELRVGDTMPVAPGVGFVVRVMEPERALVLYADDELMREQTERARLAGEDQAPANLRAAGAFMEGAQPSDFSASWAFILRDLGDGRTRLIERITTRFGASDKPWTRFTLPFMGFGVFVMVRRQLLGIKERVEGERQPEASAAAA